ncbi:HEAT repeat protein [Bradyrhizobium macuxiense]|uniref:HEAT repeat protein n=1 Tax=Bradyrhizobium macuxiense TaxID=1755647 RepID=A0A560KU64_9BRAD|nr:HEAT repeat domain-containing protein [Bradyrhizobium macuxiense]TWB86771.1 HEAT repeat protein [Bradyrhizobium macuxiense]
MDRYDYFMSFGGRDSSVAAAEIVRELEAGFDLYGWIDLREVKGGDEWFTLINHALKITSAFVLCIGPEPVSRWCRLELAVAVARKAAEPSYGIVVVSLPGARMDDIPILEGLAKVLIWNTADPAQLRSLASTLRGTRPPPYDWIEALKQAGIKQTDAELAVVQQKYVDRLYVRRSVTQRQLAEFLESDSQVFLLLGEAGVGKTNFVCDYARREGSYRPIFLLRASALVPQPNSIETAIASIVEASTGQRIGSPVFPVLTGLLRGSRLLVIIDALNEAQLLPQFTEVLGATLHRARGSAIQFLLTCRRADWRFFKNDPRVTSNIWASESSDQRYRYGRTLARFNEDELDEAWALYQPYFTIQGQLTASVRAVCDHPLMLRFFCEAYRGKPVPPFIQTTDVFEKYWKAKVERVGDGRSRIALTKLALHLRMTRRTALNEDDAIELVTNEAYNHLVSEEIILLTYEDRQTLTRFVGFMYEAFFEYCLAKAVLAGEEWRSRKPNEIVKGLTALLQEARSNRAMVGVIEFILLFYQDEQYFDELLDSVEVSPEWRHSLCVLLPRLRNFDKRHVARLHKYVGDESYWVRWAAAYALAQLPNAEEFFEAVEAWFTDDRWQAREGAANALAHHPSKGKQWSRLVHWADDASWRVRRAVALGINRCLAAGVVPISKLEELTSDLSWRRRDVAIVSQRDLQISPKSSGAVLGLLIHDRNERVRFDLAKFLSAIPITSNVLPMLRVLTDDESPWVRRRVAKSIVRFVQDESDVPIDILGVLGSDTNGSVRWEVARVLAVSHPMQERLRTILEKLRGDPDESVRTAAEFSARYGVRLASMDFEQVLLACDHRLLDIREAVARVEDALRPPSDIAEKQSTLYASWRPDHYPGIVRAITLVSERIPQAKFLELLRLLLQDAEEGVRWAMAQMVATLRTDLDIRKELAKALLADSHVWVRQAMLEELTPTFLAENPDLGPSLITLVDDEDPDLRLALVLAAKRLREQLGALTESILGTLKFDPVPEVAQAARRSIERRQ